MSRAVNKRAELLASELRQMLGALLRRLRAAYPDDSIWSQIFGEADTAGV